MLRAGAVDNIDVLKVSADAAALRNRAISNNLANADTPGYKRKDIHFENELKQALGSSKFVPMDTKVRKLRSMHLMPQVYTDYAGVSYRLDGNNVDPDTENVMLASNQVKYNGLAVSLRAEFQNLTNAMRSNV